MAAIRAGSDPQFQDGLLSKMGKRFRLLYPQHSETVYGRNAISELVTHAFVLIEYWDSLVLGKALAIICEAQRSLILVSELNAL